MTRLLSSHLLDSVHEKYPTGTSTAILNRTVVLSVVYDSHVRSYLSRHFRMGTRTSKNQTMRCMTHTKTRPRGYNMAAERTIFRERLRPAKSSNKNRWHSGQVREKCTGRNEGLSTIIDASSVPFGSAGTQHTLLQARQLIKDNESSTYVKCTTGGTHGQRPCDGRQKRGKATSRTSSSDAPLGRNMPKLRWRENASVSGHYYYYIIIH